MKLLHFADLHLGADRYGRLDPASGLNTRFAEFLRCLDAVVERALAEPVDLVLCAGDAFRCREPPPTHQCEFAARIRRLSAAGIPTLLLVGNHDLPARRERATSVDIYHRLEVPGVTVIRRPGVYRLETPAGPVQVAGLPSPERGSLVDEDPDPELSAEGRRRREGHLLGELIARLAAEVRDADEAGPRILAAHVWVEGAFSGVEATLWGGLEPLVARQNVVNPAFDYVALGHIHRHQDLNAGGHPPVVYAGSLARVDFGEEGDRKGFVLVDLERGRADCEFVPVPAREFLTMRARAAGPMATEQVIAEIGRHDVADRIVRVLVQMEEDAPLDLRAIRRALSGAHWIGPVIKQVPERPLVRSGALAERAPDALAALEEYLRLRQVSAERAGLLRRYAAELVEELRQQESEQ